MGRSARPPRRCPAEPTPLAVVPGGTGNVLAGSLGIAGMRPAIEAIRRGRPRTIDLGEARWGRPGRDRRPTAATIFLVACGMGLDARIMAAAEHEWKRRMRFGAYVGAALRELTRLGPAEFRIVADGEPIEMRGYLALVANAGELVPGRIGPRRPIDPTDGRLDLIVLGGGNPIAGLHGAARLMLGTHEAHEGVIRRAVEHVRIEAEPSQPIETTATTIRPGGSRRGSCRRRSPSWDGLADARPPGRVASCGGSPGRCRGASARRGR